MKTYKEFTQIKKEYKQRQFNYLKEIKNQIKDIKTLDDLKNNYHFKNLLTERQAQKTLKEIKQILTEKETKATQKNINTFNEKMDRIANAETINYIKISVEWRKNQTWGMNPHAEVWANGYTTGKASGCGYDKLSSAIASAFNQNDNILKLILNKIEEAKRQNKNIRDFVGYGVGIYGFEGGVGYSSFRHIFDNLGAKVNEWHETKTSDFMYIEF